MKTLTSPLPAFRNRLPGILHVKISVLVLLLFLTATGYAQELPARKNNYLFSIRYLGIKVAEVRVSDSWENSKGVLAVEAKSTAAGKIAFPINSRYSIEYTDNYLPLSYHKDVHQRRFSMHKAAIFNRVDNQVTISINNEITTLDLHPEARDFFSTLFYLSYLVNSQDSSNKQGETVVYANNNYWSADYTNTGKAGEKLYRIILTNISGNEYSRSDVLTNNLIKEDTVLYLLFAEDGQKLPVKAEFQGSPFSVYWHLEQQD